jgi:hypothetical protein
MPEKLVQFLCELAVDSKKLAEYEKDPDTAMQKAGLEPGERAALTSKNPHKVYVELLGDPSGGRGPEPGFWGFEPSRHP